MTIQLATLTNPKLRKSNLIFSSSLSALGTDVLDVEKPVVFTYEDILFSTDGFSDSNLLGRGIYGSVYFGFLRDQVCVFLLRNSDHMTATKMRNSDHRLTFHLCFVYLMLLGSCNQKNDCYKDEGIYGRDESLVQGPSCKSGNASV